MVQSGKNISIRGIGKTFESQSGDIVEALRPTDLEVGAGEFVVIVGPSGCGKTTLLYMLAGLSQATTGGAYVGDDRIKRPSIDRGMVFQSYALFPWLSVVGNVEFGLELKGVPKQQRRQIALQYLQSVALQDFAERRIDELSGGMKQRVAIARAFATEPSIILMDEPFGALDALTRGELQRQLLQVWHEYRKTIIFITHSVVEAITLADRIVVMTARPGGIKRIVGVQLAHPRDPTSDGFRDYERELYDELRIEQAQAFAAESRGIVGTRIGE